MKNWNTFPLVRVFIPFAAGIITAISCNVEINVPLWLLFFFLCVIGTYVFYFARRISYRTRWIMGPVVFCMLFLCGFELTVLRTEKFDDRHFINLPDKGRYCLVRILEPPQERELSVRAEAEIMAAGDSSWWKTCTGKVLLYFQKDTFSEKLVYGDVLLLNVWPEPVRQPQNPGEFDYKAFLAHKSVYHQAYVPAEKIISLSKGYTNPVYRAAYAIRDGILSIFRANQLTGKEYAVTGALLIGYTEKLDQDLLQEYSGTGAMHLLSVSGLHVGIIFIMLNVLLFFLDRRRTGRIIKTILLLLAIWSYALITGLSPPVLRASAMFSLVVIGRVIGRESEIYNNLAASMIVLLMVDPFYITDVGFQLSYIAVIGIVSIQPYMARWWTPRWWIFRQVWGIITVSIAAQLATFPISIYYFHQFPNYFLITNLVAIPLSGFVMYAGMATLAFSFSPFLSGYIAKVLVALVWTLNKSISLIEDMPGAVSRGLYVTAPETLLIFILIVCLLIFLVKKKKSLLIASAIAGVMLLSSFLIRNLSRMEQHQMIVYDINKNAACDLISGRNRVFLADTALLADSKKQDFHTKDNLARMGITGVEKSLNNRDDILDVSNGVYKRGHFIQFLDRRIAFLTQREACLRKIKVDYLVISGNPKIRVSEMLEQYDAGMIIIDSSNPKYKADQWLKECRILHIPCYSVLQSGAYVADL